MFPSGQELKQQRNEGKGCLSNQVFPGREEEAREKWLIGLFAYTQRRVSMAGWGEAGLWGGKASAEEGTLTDNTDSYQISTVATSTCLKPTAHWTHILVENHLQNQERSNGKSNGLSSLGLPLKTLRTGCRNKICPISALSCWGKHPSWKSLGIKYVFDMGGRPGFYNGLGKGAFEAALARLLIHTAQGLWK